MKTLTYLCIILPYMVLVIKNIHCLGVDLESYIVGQINALR
jgi:hypothetical protein